MKKIVLASHAVFIKEGGEMHGSAHVLADFLRKKKVSFYFIKHALDGKSKTEIEFFGFAPEKIEIRKKGRRAQTSFFRLAREVVVTLFFAYKIASVDVYIGVDPLNALAGVILRKLKLVKTVVYFTPDFSKRRFASVILNKIYHLVDRFDLRNSDFVWNASRRITGERIKQGVPKEKNFYIPNSADFERFKRLPFDQIKKHDMVLASNLTKSLDYGPAFFEGLGKIVAKYPDTRLLVLGSGDYEEIFKKEVAKYGLGKAVIFMGRKSYDEVINILPQCGLGLAIYSGKSDWNFYGDAKKAWDYLAAGLPVIINDIPENARLVSEAGAGELLARDFTAEDFFGLVDKIFGDKDYYQKLKDGAVNLAREYDIMKILEERAKDLNII